MNNIRIIKTSVDVSGILKQLTQYPEDWGSQKNLKNTQQLDPTKYLVTADVLQLIMGGITKQGEYVGDTEICIPTPAYQKHTEVVKFVKKYFKKLKRCGFLALPPGEQVGRHIDFGSYYLTKDRYHLSIQGRYLYTCGDEEIIIEPGTFFWFNNKLEHSALNIGDDVRITFVFDVPHHKKNL
jgi:mannose-6-phosphate isomerase-like protein (cupin superfamily)